jgi:hypothetical protein
MLLSLPRWNDLIFGLLFLAQFGAYVAISVISLRALGASSSGGGLGQGGGTSLTLNSSTAYLLAIISGTGLILSIAALGIVRMFPTFVLELSLLLSVLLSVAYAVYLWYVKYYSGAIIFTVVRPPHRLNRSKLTHRLVCCHRCYRILPDEEANPPLETAPPLCSPYRK